MLTVDHTELHIKQQLKCLKKVIYIIKKKYRMRHKNVKCVPTQRLPSNTKHMKFVDAKVIFCYNSSKK